MDQRTFEKKLSAKERLVLRGQKVFMTLAQARVVTHHLVTLDWVSLVFDGSKVRGSTFFEASEESSEPSGASLSGDQAPSVLLFEELRIIRALVRKFAQITGFDLGELRPGRNFYKHSWLLVNDQGEEVGSVSGGGQSQRDTFNFVLRGSGCTFAKRGWQRHLYDFAKSLEARIARVDLALDLFEGQGGGISSVRDAYLNGSFDYNGRRPTSTQNGSWDHGHSRTYNIGARGSKSFTAYEKGHQYGLMDSLWWRCELRLGNQDRILDLEILIEPDQFFAGSYPFAAGLLESVEPQVIKVTKRVAEVVSDAVIERKLKWFTQTVAPSIVHLTRFLDHGVNGFMWLVDLAVKEANRDMPRSLRTVPTDQLSSSIRKFLTPSSHAPAVLATS